MCPICRQVLRPRPAERFPQKSAAETGRLFPGKKSFLPRKSGTFFTAGIIYWPGVFSKGAKTMPDCTDPWGDLDDLIFDQEDGGPSER